MSQYWSKIVGDLSPYVPGEQPKVDGLIKLNTNENPYGPSPTVIKAINNAANADLRKYCDPNATALTQTIADYYQLSSNQVFVGNGSDEVLAHTFQALLKHDKPLLFPDITYSFYPVYCALYQIDYNTIALNDQLSIDINDYAIDNGGIIFANPNAPTGIALELKAIRKLLQQNKNSVVVVDEAYVDFGAESAMQLIPEFDNLLVVQTLSKSRSLAGMRIGFACGHAGLIEALTRVKDSFNSYPLDMLAQAAAIAAMNDQPYFQDTCQQVIKTREIANKELEKLGFTILPSATNFVLAQHGKIPARDIFTALRERNVLVRYFAKARIDNYLRITIGTDQEMQALYSALQEILAISKN